MNARHDTGEVFAYRRRIYRTEGLADVQLFSISSRRIFEHLFRYGLSHQTGDAEGLQLVLNRWNLRDFVHGETHFFDIVDTPVLEVRDQDFIYENQGLNA